MKLTLYKAKRLIERSADILLVAGDGSSFPQDHLRFSLWQIHHDSFSIGRSIKHLKPPVTHWGTVDGEVSIWWAENLPPKCGDPLRHTMGEFDGFDVDWEAEQADYDKNEIKWYGSSALFACLAGLEMGYRAVILAGCPMDENGHWYLPGQPGPGWHKCDLQAWRDFAKEYGTERVKSLSGNTAHILGEATREWAIGYSR